MTQIQIFCIDDVDTAYAVHGDVLEYSIDDGCCKVTTSEGSRYIYPLCNLIEIRVLVDAE